MYFFYLKNKTFAMAEYLRKKVQLDVDLPLWFLCLSLLQTLSCQALRNWTVWEMWVQVPNEQIRDPTKHQCNHHPIIVSHHHYFMPVQYFMLQCNGKRVTPPKIESFLIIYSSSCVPIVYDFLSSEK